MQVAAKDIIARTQRQVGRVDQMLSSIFDRVERAGTFVSDAVAQPMRQLSGVIASVKAVVDTLRDPEGGNTVHDAYRYPDPEAMAPPRPTGAGRNMRP